MNLSRRIIGIGICLLLMLQGLPAMALAAETEGTCGDALAWHLNDGGTLTISGSGAVDSYPSYSDAPWYGLRSDIISVVLEAGVTGIGENAFGWCNNLRVVQLPAGLELIASNAFYACGALNHVLYGGTGEQKAELTIQNTGNGSIRNALWHSEAGGSEVQRRSSCMGTGLFCSICHDFVMLESAGSGSHTYENGEDLTCGLCGYVRTLTGITIQAVPNRTHYTVFEDGPEVSGGVLGLLYDDGTETALDMTPDLVSGFDNTGFGSRELTVSYGGFSQTFPVTVVPGTPDSLTITAPAGKTAYAAGEPLDLTGLVLSAGYEGHGTVSLPLSCVQVVEPDMDTPGTKTVILTVGERSASYDIEVRPAYRVMLKGEDFSGFTAFWIDGVEYAVVQEGEDRFLDLPDGNARTMTAYTYHEDASGDVHTRYPETMMVWTLKYGDGGYTVWRQADLDGLLNYSGSSIRVVGQKGIRMITSIEQWKKNALISGGLAGYTLKEYGTAIAWADQISSARPLTLKQAHVRSNYAYQEGVADPVFRYNGEWMQYTNVLVNFSNEQCKKDIAMRPYMILEAQDGQQITLYGGIVQRSIGYIAYQNRLEFEPGTEEYEYIWEIIHYVYGDRYDEDYKNAWTKPSL